MKLYLLDAYALIYRAYYAFIKNPRINSRGENTSAILGFTNTLEEVIQKEQPTLLAAPFAMRLIRNTKLRERRLQRLSAWLSLTSKRYWRPTVSPCWR